MKNANTKQAAFLRAGCSKQHWSTKGLL